MYRHIAFCTVHGRDPFNEKKLCQLCGLSTDSIINAKPCTIKDIFMVETSIVEFRQQLYIPEIQKLAFHLPHVHILLTNIGGNTPQEAFNHC